jgi:hypothetical protein
MFELQDKVYNLNGALKFKIKLYSLRF